MGGYVAQPRPHPLWHSCYKKNLTFTVLSIRVVTVSRFPLCQCPDEKCTLHFWLPPSEYSPEYSPTNPTLRILFTQTLSCLTAKNTHFVKAKKLRLQVQDCWVNQINRQIFPWSSRLFLFLFSLCFCGILFLLEV